jgi:hypothetical protein
MIPPNVVQQEVNEVRNYRYHCRYYLCQLSSSKSVACLMTSRHTILSLVTVWEWTRKAQSVWRHSTDWTVRETNPSGSEILRTRPYRP